MIKSLNLKNFTCFNNKIFEFSPGINVFIGENGTGKTHLMKVLAASLRSVKDWKLGPDQANKVLEIDLARNLMGYFKPDELSSLASKDAGNANVEIAIKATEGNLEYDFSKKGRNTTHVLHAKFSERPQSIFLPSKEIFSIFEGLQKLMKEKEIALEDTYLHLAEELDSNELKEGPRFDAVKKLLNPIEKIVGAKAFKKGGKFYLNEEKVGNLEAHLVAEGIRKIGSIMYLIATGSLSNKSILFWDEPESNLNPKLSKMVCDLLASLSENGVQIFIATHDYLISQRLSLMAEYPQKDNATNIRFFGLSKSDSGVNVQTANTLLGIDNNPILDEFAAYYDFEQEKFLNQLNAKSNH